MQFGAVSFWLAAPTLAAGAPALNWVPLWLLTIGACLGLGGLTYAMWVDGRPRVPRMAVGGALLVATALLIELATGSALPASSETAWRLVAALLLVASSWWARANQMAGKTAMVAGLWAFLLLLLAQASELAVRGGYGIAFQFLHMSAAAVWIGGLIALRLDARSRNSVDLRARSVRFATLALIAVMVLAGTGLVMAMLLAVEAWRADVDAVRESVWVRYLFVKLLAFAGMLGAASLQRAGLARGRFAAWLATRGLAADDPQFTRTLLRWEIVFALIVLAFAALMVAGEPPQAGAV
jgi:putative copper export protein